MNLLCNYCHKPANYSCGRCKVDRYCSQNCQLVDFPSHRFVCFNVPALIPSVELESLAVMPNSDDDLPVVSKLQLVDANQNETIVNLNKPPKEVPQKQEAVPLNHIPEREKRKIVINEVPEKPQRPSKTNESQVVKEDEQVKATGSRVILSENQTAANRQVVNEAPLKTPAFNPGPRTLPPESQKQLKIPSTSAPIQKLPIANETPKNPMHLMQKLAAAKKSKENQRIFFKDVKHRELEIKDHKVAVMNGDPENKLLYVLETFDANIEDYLGYIADTIKDIVSISTIADYVPEKQEMILARFEGEFYRGVHTGNVKQEYYEVFFVDYGNVSYCPPTEIKPLTKSLQMDIILHKIYLENLTLPLSKKAMQLFGGEAPIAIKVNGKKEDGSYSCQVIGL